MKPSFPTIIPLKQQMPDLNVKYNHGVAISKVQTELSSARHTTQFLLEIIRTHHHHPSPPHPHMDELWRLKRFHVQINQLQIVDFTKILNQMKCKTREWTNKIIGEIGKLTRYLIMGRTYFNLILVCDNGVPVLKIPVLKEILKCLQIKWYTLRNLLHFHPWE